MASLAEPRAPYPGLRPFLQSEVDLFFGRDGDVDEILNRLKTNRFVAVLGASGSGKSSLVRTGVLEALELGLLRKAGSSWRFVDLRPGGRPIANLARALLASRAAGKMDPLEGAGKVDPEEAESLATMLQRGPRSIIEWSHAALEFGGASGPRTNLLILVDQFEELFGYDTYAKQEQAQAFVNLLIESASEPSLPIYVVLTMRSEYLGACALIDGLAEAINRGQYLTPRLSREQCRLAIEEPARVCGVEIESALTNRLLNDLAAFAPWNEIEVRPVEGKEPGSLAGTAQLDRLARRADQLPLMQHVLNRLWTQAIDRGETPPKLKLKDYNASGGLRGTLSGHADEVLEKLVKTRGEGIRPVAETVFRALVNGASVADAVRRRTSVGKLVELSNGKRDDVLAVVEAYRAPRCNFLVTEREELDEDTLVDISHESLIRQWKKLREWVEAEAATAAWWRRLREDAVEWDRLNKDPARQPEANEQLLRDIELTRALELQAAYRPSSAWTEQYGGDHKIVGHYLDASVQAHNTRLKEKALQEETQRDRRRLQYRIGGALAIAIVVAALTSWFWHQERQGFDALKLNTAHTSIDSTLSTAMSHQSTGDWIRAGTIITTVTAPLLVIDERQRLTFDGKLKKELTEALDKALQRQRANFRAGDGIRPLAMESGPDRPQGQAARQTSREPRLSREPLMHAYYGYPAHRATAVASVFDNSIEIYWSDASDTWSGRQSISLAKLSGPTSSETVDISGVGFYGGGNHLAVVSGDVIFMGSFQDFAANEVRPVLIKRREDQTAARGSRELENTYADLSFSALYACHATLPHFLARDDDDAFWVIIASADGAEARRLLKGEAPNAWTTDPDRGRYALARGNRIYVGECSGDAEPNTDISVRMDRGIRDIEFTAPDVLGVAGKAGQVRFIDIGQTGQSTPREETVDIPEGTKYLRFAYGRQVWLTPADRLDSRQTRASPRESDERDVPAQSREGTMIELWDATTGKVAGTIIPDRRSKFLDRVGTSPWLAFTSSDGTLAVQKPVLRSPLPLPELAAAAVAIGGGVAPLDIEKSTRQAYDLMRSSGVKIRPETPTEPPLDCARALERLVDDIERSDGDIRAEPVIASARQIKSRCEQKLPADRLERELLVWLRDEILGNSDASEMPMTMIRHHAAVLAARGDSTGLRLLAVGFSRDRTGSAPQALRALAARNGRQLPYPLLDRARREPTDRSLSETLLGRQESSDGRDEEVRALLLLSRDRHAEALAHLSAAQRYYFESGDRESAASIGILRYRTAAKLSDQELANLWRRMHPPSTPPAKPVQAGVPGAPPGMSPEPILPYAALEKVAGLLSDPIARSELLVEAANAAPTNELKIDLLTRAVEAATSQRPTRLEDTPKLAEAASQLVQLGARSKAAAVIAEHLARLDARGDVSEEAVRRITSALRIAIDAKAWSDAEPLARLADMNWGFVNFRWTSRLDDGRRTMLAAAHELQEALVAAGVNKTSLRLAQARTRFWLGVLTIQRDDAARQVRAKYFTEAVASFDSKPPIPHTFEIRLQMAEALRWHATFLPFRSKKDFYAVADERNRARSIYETLLAEMDAHSRRDADFVYVRTATVAGLSSVLRALASVGTEIAREELGENNIDGARKAAVTVMRNVYEQAALFEPGRYADIKVDNPAARPLCCLRAENQAEDAWMVGLLAGAEALAGDNLPAPTQCEKLAAHAFDPERRARGVPVDPKAIAACEREAKETAEPARTAYHLGRAYAFAGGPNRESALEQFALAASGNYTQAFYNLSFAFSQRSRTCSVVPALLDRYRYLVLRDYLQPALQTLRDHLQPTDEPVVAWLRKLAESEPDTTRVLPKLGDPLPLTFLKGLCE